MLRRIWKVLKLLTGYLLLLVAAFGSYVLVVDGPLHSLRTEILPPLFGFAMGGYLVRIPVNVTADSAVRDRFAARCGLGRFH